MANNLNDQPVTGETHKWVEENSKIAQGNDIVLMTLALAQSRVDVVKLLIAKGDDNIVSLAMIAIGGADTDVLDLLLANGLDINRKIKINEDDRITFLYFAVACDQLEAVKTVKTVKWLLDHGADINARSDILKLTAMHMAAQTGKAGVMRYLKEQGADIYARANGDQSPMDTAVIHNQTESIKCLKELGFDVNTKDNDGRTPLFTASMIGKTECIKCLVALGADVNAKNNDGWTPLYQAVGAGEIESIKCLAALGADVNAKDNDGWTPLFNAPGKGLGNGVECIKCLAALGADIEARNNLGQTPIFAAAGNVNSPIACMECLKKLGAKLDAKDNEGKTALDLAIKLKEAEAADWLRANGVGYEQLVQEMNKASTEKEYLELVLKFRDMDGYKDAAALAVKCDTQYRAFKEQREKQERHEQDRQRNKIKSAQRKWKIGFFSSIVCAVISAIMFFTVYMEICGIVIIHILPFLFLLFTSGERKILRIICVAASFILSIFELNWIIFYIFGHSRTIEQIFALIIKNVTFNHIGIFEHIKVNIIFIPIISNITACILVKIFPSDS